MSPTPEPDATLGGLALSLARLEGKIDASLARSDQRLDDHDRRAAACDQKHTEADGRLRVVEAAIQAIKPRVSPWQVVTALVAVASVLTTVIIAIAR